jgi:hypothetical protein
MRREIMDMASLADLVLLGMGSGSVVSERCDGKGRFDDNRSEFAW